MDRLDHYLQLTAHIIENLFLVVGTVVTSAGTIEAMFRRLPTKAPMSFVLFLSAQSIKLAQRIRRAQPVFHALARFFQDLDVACENVCPQRLVQTDLPPDSPTPTPPPV